MWTFGSVLMTAAGWAQTAPDALETELVRQTKVFLDAWKKQDMTALQATMAPDFVYVGPEGIGSRESVAQGLGHCALTSYSMSDAQVHRMGETVASLVYRLHQQASCGGHALPTEMVAADTFMRGADGRWQLSMTLLTPVETHGR